jgi:hypothetical protein
MHGRSMGARGMEEKEIRGPSTEMERNVEGDEGGVIPMQGPDAFYK